jgi:hypothetical protein
MALTCSASPCRRMLLLVTAVLVAAAVVGAAGGCWRPWLREVPATCGSPAQAVSSATHQRGNGHDLWVSGHWCGIHLVGASDWFSQALLKHAQALPDALFARHCTTK